MKEEGGEGVELEQEGEESRDKEYEDEDFVTQDEVITINIVLSIDTCIK